MTKRIHLISGPRNISTAFMYSWANRLDTKVVDEPFYAYYLSQTGINYHPGTKEILESQSTDYNYILENSIFCDIETPVLFIKNMAHHILNCELDFLFKLENVFLIRNPAQLITSFAKVVETPTIDDIGLKREWELYAYLLSRGEQPIVLDANDILSSPRLMLGELCERLDVDFTDRMLTWKEGPIPDDGIWAKYWYSNVWKSTGFAAADTSIRLVPQRLSGLYEESLSYYNLLSENKLVC